MECHYMHMHMDLSCSGAPDSVVQHPAAQPAAAAIVGGATVILVSKKLAKWLSPVKNIEVGDTQNAPDHHQSLKWPGVLPGATPDPLPGTAKRPAGRTIKRNCFRVYTIPHAVCRLYGHTAGS